MKKTSGFSLALLIALIPLLVKVGQFLLECVNEYKRIKAEVEQPTPAPVVSMTVVPQEDERA